MPVPIQEDAQRADWSKRIQVYTTVDASPAAAAETIIATLTIAGFADTPIISGISLSGWAAFTVGTSGASVRFRIRQTGIAGAIKADTGVLTGGVAAGNLLAQDVEGFDAGAGVGVYVLTMQVGSGAAASTVSALKLQAILV